MAAEKAKEGIYPLYFTAGMTQKDVTAKAIAQAAFAGDDTAKEVYRLCGEYLGKGLSIIIDILNPERIILGSIFARSSELIRPAMEQVIAKEALSPAAHCCQILPAALGENIGDYAAIATAIL